MALDIDDPETERLARQLASLTGLPLTAAVKEALESRLVTVRARVDAAPDRRRLLKAIAARGHDRAVLDDRTAEQILGYDADGVPT